MKTITAIIGALLFSTLFFKQNIGLNLSLFTVLTIVILALQHPEKIRVKSTMIYTFAYMLTAAVVFLNHSGLAVFANCIAFFTFIGTFAESRSSIYVRWLNGIYTTAAGYFQRRSENRNNEKQNSWKTSIDFPHLAKLVGIPLVVIIVFTLLYKNGNPIFNDFISRINFEFINFQWLFFTVLGYYLFNNIVSPVKINQTTNQDLEINNKLNRVEPLNRENLRKELQLGTVLMGLLNVLLVFYCITDIYSLMTNSVSSAAALSNQVHNGINALIASIIIAIFIILYFFRGNLNFYENNIKFKRLSYIWISLNIILVVLIAIKNNTYVVNFGFTYKRIGVFVYLLLTIVGLVTTFLKVRNIKNLWYLFRINTQIAFAFLVVASCADWDFSVTKYNLEHAETLDIDYLIGLTDNNAVLLQEYVQSNYVSEVHAEKIENKYESFIETIQRRNWQELTYDNVTLF